MLARSVRANVETLCRTEEFGAWVRQRATERARCGVEGDVLDRPFALTARVHDLVCAFAPTSARDDGVAVLTAVARSEVEDLETDVADARAAVERYIAGERGGVCRNLDPSERLVPPLR